MDQLESLK